MQEASSSLVYMYSCLRCFVDFSGQKNEPNEALMLLTSIRCSLIAYDFAMMLIRISVKLCSGSDVHFDFLSLILNSAE